LERGKARVTYNDSPLDMAAGKKTTTKHMYRVCQFALRLSILQVGPVLKFLWLG